MRLLVLGGTHHVGRAVVETALERGDDVTTLNRGRTGAADDRVDARHADRLDRDAVTRVLGGDTWDAVVDTWSGAPNVVGETARLLRGRAGHLGYVSSRSVYAWPIPHGADESAPTVDGDPAATDDEDYAAAKRGGELATEAFGGPVLLARAGLILGPYEIVGRLPWWLGRVSRGGPVPAPGPRERPLQYVDVRDLAAWMLDAARSGTAGAFNSVSEAGHTTMGDLLAACVEVTESAAELVWFTPAQIAAAGVAPWTQLPIWMPPTGPEAALHDGDVSAALAAGLRCRPVGETVADTWRWLRIEGFPANDPGRAGALGMSPDDEQRLWAQR